MNTFTVTTNFTTEQSTTIGEILILTKPGFHGLNITSSGFDKLITTFNISALQNISLEVGLGSIFTFNLIREKDNTIFDFNGTNETKLTIFCPNQSIEFIFNTSSNRSEIVNCKFTLMQMTVDYGTLGSYFRTLIPSFAVKNITWYLMDLNKGDTVIQKILTLLDLTGDFGGAILTVNRTIGEKIRTIIRQRFDISDQVNLFLLKDQLYTLSIDNVVQDIVLGNLIPTEAGTQTITLPKLDFAKDEIILGSNITIGYTFNVTQSILRVQYNDGTNRTTLVRFTVRNATDSGIVFQSESDNNSTVTFTYNQVLGNITYLSELFVLHQDLINFTDKKIFYKLEEGGSQGAIDLKGWNTQEQKDIKKWIAFLFLAVWVLLFSKLHAGLGMTTLVIWVWIFRSWNWIDVNAVVFGFLAIFVIVAWIVEAIKKQ